MQQKFFINVERVLVGAFLLLSGWSSTVQLGSAADQLPQFYGITGSLCINSSFVSIHHETRINRIGCAALCSRDRRCQAFTMADGPCQLFVFDECSKSVRNCSCSRRGQVFVKQQPGLEPGALCPPGYGDDLRGVKYRLYKSTGNFSQSRQKCQSESGLVIMADVEDATEMSHVDMVYSKYGLEKFFLGGYQVPGSAEPNGGWYWVSCNIPLKSSFWALGEPNDWADPTNDVAIQENAVARLGIGAGLADVRDDFAGFLGVLCECVSPFD